MDKFGLMVVTKNLHTGEVKVIAHRTIDEINLYSNIPSRAGKQVSMVVDGDVHSDMGATVSLMFEDK